MLSARRPGRDHVGIELSWTAATHLFRRLQAAELTNVRALLGDAEELVRHNFVAGQLDEVFVNHPCPWPKSRHVVRRLLARSFLALLAERMRPGAKLTVVTDHADYARWLGGELAAQSALVSCHATAEVASLPERTPTKYQLKAMAQGIPIHYFEWRKADGANDAPATPERAAEISMPTLILAGAGGLLGTLLAALAVIATVYISVQYVTIGLVPNLQQEKAPIAAAFSILWGPAGIVFASFAAMISVWGWATGNGLQSPRLLFSMAERGEMPGVLARVHPKFRTPHVSIIVFSLVAGALAILGTFEWNAVAVPADSPIKTIKDFTEALKKDPGSLPIGGGSAGGVDHVTLALIAKASGVPADKINYVGFSGGAEMLTALGGGRLKGAISGVSEMVQLANAGRIRIIAVTSEKGNANAKAPSLKESGIDLVLGNWRGIMGAPEMSAAGKKMWIERLDKMCAAKEWTEGLAKQGLENACLTGDKYAAFLKDEQTRWAATLKDVGIAK